MEKINLNDFAKEVHQNAVEHGWWEGERCLEEILALIHSEWSEALEEYREGRPVVWHKCPYNGGKCETQEVHTGVPECSRCGSEMRKPEGFCVELIDGCIRILDYFGHKGYRVSKNVGVTAAIMADEDRESIPKAITRLHQWTTMALEKPVRGALTVALFYAFEIVRGMGEDPNDIMKEKHEYNKSRPYKHGGKVC